jgi:hypothetical protein
MGALERTRFGDWTEYGYSSFYKRYVSSLEAIARGRFGCREGEAQALAHGFIADQASSPTGGLLATFDRSKRFRPYLVTAFFNHCRRQLKNTGPLPLDFDPTAPPRSEPEWTVLAEEAESLRRKVRTAVNIAREGLLKEGRLSQQERAYLELKWPLDPEQLPLPDREIGEELVRREVLEPKVTAAALTRSACRIGERVGKKLLYDLRRLLREEYERHVPEGEVAAETSMSLKTIVHMLGIEEATS